VFRVPFALENAIRDMRCRFCSLQQSSRSAVPIKV
jgi:hypothetical protein